MQFIYSILRFFWQLFGMNMDCACGANILILISSDKHKPRCCVVATGFVMLLCLQYYNPGRDRE